MNYLSLIGREKDLFESDITNLELELSSIIKKSNFLVLGGAGSIGQAVTKEIFKRSPKKIHVVDINENNLVELVRDLRSSYGYIKGDFRTFALDIGSNEYTSFFYNEGPYDYVLNLSALKHVRSEKDPYTLMRMIEVNIFNTDKTIKQSIEAGVKKYFCVSTDKAANPVNMMGASKKIMEMFLMRHNSNIKISTARFANVAFSDGSLLHGFNQRIQKNQPIVAPNDIKRYFITPQESGELCLISCIFGENGDILFPKLNEKLDLQTFSDIAKKFLKIKGIRIKECNTEDEAREFAKSKVDDSVWPCLFSKSDTTGEKDFEEFFTDNEILDMNSYESIGVIKNDTQYDNDLLKLFETEISKLKNKKHWIKNDIISIFIKLLPDFYHEELNKDLDGKM